jgi:hypothetical protein
MFQQFYAIIREYLQLGFSNIIKFLEFKLLKLQLNKIIR